jgi:hypothetical protein
MSEKSAPPVPDPVPAGLPTGLAALAAEAGPQAKPRPVERWDPPDCGAIDMRIAIDGTWYYRGSPIGREALTRLFASILRREPDGRHVLVTPVEKVSILVDDAPFVAVQMRREGEGVAQRVVFRTNVGDIVEAGPDHPLRFAVEVGTGGLKPYVLVRGRLEALVSRAVQQELVTLATEEEGRPGIHAGGVFYAFPRAALG